MSKKFSYPSDQDKMWHFFTKAIGYSCVTIAIILSILAIALL